MIVRFTLRIRLAKQVTVVPATSKKKASFSTPSLPLYPAGIPIGALYRAPVALPRGCQPTVQRPLTTRPPFFHPARPLAGCRPALARVLRNIAGPSCLFQAFVAHNYS